MLSPRNRIRRSAEFGLVMRKGRRAGRDALTVVLLVQPLSETAPVRTPASPASSSPVAEQPRVGFIVSKAVGGAVVRKRVQRKLRHLMRDRVAELPTGSLLVVRAKPASAILGHDALAAQLDGALASVQRPRRPSAQRGRVPRGAASASAGGEQSIQ
ncbi:ribonuclease P protein component [Nocardiopsis ansamitocini]|uniref:Ribonuclease P protein component n=1 Tax=Nocardiopsis ansamitocini TaxID=1670832 RepID=A0A9W6UGA1_9ACTN|nr:ribonuclease P protein component [Nocardiopsis ansamitocini]GLU46996.1 ribonuclease P protein component [Nocardiopsis ansamitocini]